MRTRARFLRLLAVAASSAAVVSCGGGVDRANCIPAPCPLPIVIVVNVTAMGGTPVDRAFVKVSGPYEGTIPCSGGPVNTCGVAGTAGTYSLEVGAPGFESAKETVVVKAQGVAHECGCESVETRHVDVALNPAR
jgi:hypothetical protein